MSGVNVAATIAPKSDQLNADDLIAGPITVRIVSVTHGNSESPIRVNIEGRLPYYPCKSMRRVMVAAWGNNEDNGYVGKYMTLYRDPSVKYGGIAVGGIRISHMSGIDQDMFMALTLTKGKRAEYLVQKLAVQAAKPVTYPDAQFNEEFPRMAESIKSGRATVEQIIAHCELTAKLTQQQIEKITSILTSEPERY